MTSSSVDLVDVAGLTARGRTGLALGPVTLAVRAGEVVAVTGPHAAGKSLLLAALAGLAPSTSERLVLPARTSMVFQRDALDDGSSALDNVAIAARALAPGDRRAAAADALARVGLAGHEHVRPRMLSGGMRKRVGIARALVGAPELILADDPTAGLDPRTAAAVLDALFEGARGTGASGTRHAAVIIATTDVDDVLPRVERALFLDAGRLLFSGPPRGLAADPRTAAFAPRVLEAAAWV